MILLVVDDENLTLKMMTKTVQQVMPEAEVHSFLRADAALEFAASHKIWIAFLDIQMRGMSGTVLAARLQEMQPHINIIFCTAYDDYKGTAMDMHASGYLMKPVQAEDIRRELALLRFSPEQKSSAEEKLQVRCFGVFQVSYKGNPLPFSYQKTNELLAVLVDKNGAMCSYGMIEELLWEDDNPHSAYLKRLRNDLISTMQTLGLEDVILTQRGQIGLKTSLVKCDYFDYLAEKPTTPSYQGVYMEQYSWAEETNAALYWRKHK